MSWPLRSMLYSYRTFLSAPSVQISVTFSSTILKKSSKPRKVPENYRFPFMTIHNLWPMHLSRRVSGNILFDIEYKGIYYKVSKLIESSNSTLLIWIINTQKSFLSIVTNTDSKVHYNKMTSPGSLIEKMLSRPVEHLIMRQKRLPNLEVIRLYRDVYKYAAKFEWYNDKG